ncbi:MAG: hydrogenase accessory protein HypB [Myxococcales bacterium]|nr:hydrogenase accessory protein HypB [Myxococcales bacterium]
MCATCGCGEDHQHFREDDREHRRHFVRADDHHHHHEDDHHHHRADRARTIAFEEAVLARNQHLAAHNRAELRAREVVAINLMSSPGAGKTTLLERTLASLAGALPLAVIEGDQETQADADRIRAAGGRAVQINTGTGCHLDAAMVGRALEELDPRGGILFIENVGNLVCPALFDLGEAVRVVIASVTEGEDKPLKYPHMFRAAELVLLNKIDLLPYVEFSVDRFAANAHQVNPRARILPLSARSSEGVPAWLGFLRDHSSSDRAIG